MSTLAANQLVLLPDALTFKLASFATIIHFIYYRL